MTVKIDKLIPVFDVLSGGGPESTTDSLESLVCPERPEVNGEASNCEKLAADALAQISGGPFSGQSLRAELAYNASLKQEMLNTENIDDRKSIYEQLGEREKTIAQHFIENPEDLDRQLEELPPKEQKMLAHAVIEHFVEQGVENPEFRTMQNMLRAVKMIEKGSPDSSPKDVTRFVRRIFYSDSQLSIGAIDLGDKNSQVNIDRHIELRAYGLREWQLVKMPNGQHLDFGHAMVGADAASQSPNMLGKARSVIFTHVGDALTEALTNIGLDGAGGLNEADSQGNKLSDQLFEMIKDSKRGEKLSDHLQKALNNERPS